MADYATGGFLTGLSQAGSRGLDLFAQEIVGRRRAEAEEAAAAKKEAVREKFEAGQAEQDRQLKRELLKEEIEAGKYSKRPSGRAPWYTSTGGQKTVTDYTKQIKEFVKDPKRAEAARQTFHYILDQTGNLDAAMDTTEEKFPEIRFHDPIPPARPGTQTETEMSVGGEPISKSVSKRTPIQPPPPPPPTPSGVTVNPPPPGTTKATVQNAARIEHARLVRSGMDTKAADAALNADPRWRSLAQ